jgi:membrane protein EpsK
VTNAVAMGITMLIKFWITPIIIHKLGLAAYGYVGLIDNVINFMAVLTFTLNSMVGRFFTISLKRDGVQVASEYISSALFACVCIFILLSPLLTIIAFNLNSFINLQTSYAIDVKIAFFVTSIAFLLSTISTVFSTAAYSQNKLAISNSVTILSNITGFIVLLVLFSSKSTHVWFVGLGTISQVFISLILGFISFKFLLPEIQFGIKLFSFAKTGELLSSGLFNSIIMLGNVFLTQIDLIVGNRYLPAEIIGLYAATLIIPNAIKSIASALSSAFSPSTLIIYSEGNINKLNNFTNKVIKICGSLIGWPISIIAGLGLPILNLWIGKDFSQFKYLIVLMMLPLTVNLAVSQLYIVQQALNEVKIPAFATIILGILNLISAIVMTKYLHFGILGIVLSSVITYSLKSLVFMPLYTSMILKQPKGIFYRGLIQPLLVSCIVCGLGLLAQDLFTLDRLLTIAIAASILSVVYFLLSYVTLNPEDRLELLNVALSIKNRKIIHSV